MDEVYNVWLVNFELGQMSAFLKTLKISLEDYANKIDNLDVTDGKDVEVDDEANERFNAWYDQVQSLSPGGDYHRRLYSAFLISWYAFVEDNLLKICNDLYMKPDHNLETKKKQNTGIWLAHELIEASYSYRFDKGQWQELIMMNKVRNHIVHDGGKFAFSLEKSNEHKRYVLVQRDSRDYYLYIDKSFYDYLNNHELLCYYGTFFIKPSPEYCEHLVTFGSSLFENVLKGLNLI